MGLTRGRARRGARQPARDPCLVDAAPGVPCGGDVKRKGTCCRHRRSSMEPRCKRGRGVQAAGGTPQDARQCSHAPREWPRRVAW